MSLVNIDWNPDRKATRKFGITVFVGFTILGAALWLLGGKLGLSREAGRMIWGSLPWFVLLPVPVMLLALLWPRGARPFYWVWMGIAFVMGTVMSTILMAVTYWVVFGTIATIFRLRRRDRLVLRDPGGGSLWVETAGAPPRERYERQF
jgi:hypothetical protein